MPRFHIWRLNARRVNYPLDEQVEELMHRLTPIRGQIGRLVSELPVQARLSVCRSFNDPEGVEDDGTAPELAAKGWEKLDGQHHLLGWHLDRQVLSFLLDAGADLDVDEYG